MDPTAWGIEPGYLDASGQWRKTSPETARALLAAMRLDAIGADDERPAPAPVISETGATRCHVPGGLRTWAWAVQLYAVHSTTSWGIGDLGDLAVLARWSAGLGAGALLVSPLHAVDLVEPVQPSPYYPTSRLFRNVLNLHVEGQRPPGLGAARRIDHDAVARAKLPALEARWRDFEGDPEFDAYRRDQGDDLEAWTTFCVLVERHGRDWRGWPPGLRHPSAPDVAPSRVGQEERVSFHAWLQWLLDVQVARAAAEIALIHDVAVGFDPAGFDAWRFQDALARGVTVGAPPDLFNRAGQDWGVPPFDPWRLRASGYEPVARTLRAGFRHAGGIRVDHVMGLFRLWWVPDGADPADGAYVRYPAADLLDVLARESRRASAFVVGEDLGTVEDGVREELARRGVLSYRVAWFEDEPPDRWPAQALAAVTTHDLPTIAGVWRGTDPDAATIRSLRDRLRALTGLDDDAPVDEVVAEAYARLAQAPSAVLAATLEDGLGVDERPNLPGTTDEWPNWSLALPVAMEEAMADPRTARLAAILRR